MGGEGESGGKERRTKEERGEGEELQVRKVIKKEWNACGWSSDAKLSYLSQYIFIVSHQ